MDFVKQMRQDIKKYIDTADEKVVKMVHAMLEVNATNLDRQINECLIRLNPKQKRALLNLIKTFAEQKQEVDFWEDDAFIAELDRRTTEYETGKAKQNDEL